MAEKIRYEVDVNASDAKRGLQDFSRAAKKAGKDAEKALDDTASAGDKARAAIKAMADSMDTELRQAAKAADALGAALGPELAGRIDVDKMVADLNRMGVSFDEIRADADKFAATLREVDGIRIDQVNAGLDKTHTGLRNVHSEADQSRSVLANMAGNAAQDLGQLGGAVGTLGVGIGQLAEYAVDGNISLQNLGKVAGPLAGLTAFTVGVQAVTGALADFRAKQDAWREQQEKFNEALRETGDIVEAVNGQLEENVLLSMPPELNPFVDLLGDLPVLGRLINETDEATFDLIGTMAQAGITQAEWTQAVIGGIGPLTDMLTRIDQLGASGVLNADQVAELKNQVVLYSNATVQATAHQDAYNKVMAQTAPAVAGLAEAQELLNAAMIDSDPMAVLHSHWQALIKDAKDGTFNFENAADAINQLAAATGLTADEVVRLVNEKASEEIQAEADAADELTQNLGDAADAIADIQSEADDLDIAGALGDQFDKVDRIISGLKMDVDFEQGIGDALDQLDGFGPDIQTFVDSWQDILDGKDIKIFGNVRTDDPEFLNRLGSFQEFVQGQIVNTFEQSGEDAANTFVQSLAARVAREKGISIEQAYVLMGLSPEGTIDATIQPSIDEAAADRARRELDAIAGLGISDPRIAALQIALETDSIPGELAEIATLLLAQSLGVPVDLSEVTPQQIAEATAALAAADIPLPVTLTTPNLDRTEDDIDDATEDRTTQVIVPKSDSLGAMQKIIDFVTRDRTLQINTKADNAGATDRILDAVAAERDASIFARAANVYATDQILDNLANPGGQPRIAHINVVAHGGVSVSGGGGGGPTPEPGVAVAGLSATPTAGGTTSTLAASPAVLTVPAPTTNVFNVTLNAGVLGNHFDVERGVNRALRRHQRINGRR